MLSWVIPICLLILNANLAIALSRNTQVDPARALGQMIGSMLAWPIILMIVYGVSRRFRNKYALHTVLNFGLAINAVASASLTFHR
jgi:uncharacterized membrane protein YbhN (UPF0104 family)